MEQLSEALEASEQRFGTLEAAHQKALARLDKLEANAEICQERLGFFEEQVRNKGFDRPPCMLSEGRPSPLVEVTVLSGGEIMVRRLDPGRYEEAVSLMPGYANLDVSEPIRPEQLAGIADPILSWAREPENAFGFECVFYARVEIQTQSARDLAKALSYVNEFFYTFDQPDIRAVYRRNEN